ncbi:asparagine synthase (glutamine-hydrolyzing) [Spirulina subsalsa FACHB-351]|uniref:asparagine synthase (glutamine-hydrolyzing) n=1 Tax=Spirulina subsalsa FACHB-351 TaxID=234711 RepID=A0ABT3L6W1_9CYAN|nr:asparagine synthase (glutamine-hydrolyzing) [Spirulina subsalsa]MCW6037234.1 asparagine synthase (glutamine-hydrolyzing) [Spirulina subsalsa FACHB-351]
MCGICGVVYGERDRPVDPGLINRMTTAITHRGPDQEGYYIQNNIGLGSRRLSIIDLAGGQQPIYNEDKTICVVFNGELYNYPELTRSLTRLGHKFYTATDTEVLVHAYEEFGDEFLEYLNGMFAFALWDSRKQRLLIGRDRMGIKPLYYTLQDNALIFGSELKTILTYPGIPRNIDLVALNEYLSFEYIPTPRSIFQNIAKLPPGHALSFYDGQLKIWQYWDVNLSRSEKIKPKPAKDYQRELLGVLRNAVEKEMVSDVPVGVLLSGGLDSSTVAALMTEIAPDHVKSFSIRFDDPSFDESNYARQVAHHLKTEHYELTLTPKLTLDLVPQMAKFLDEPLGDSSFIPTFLLSQFTRHHVKVALGGDGGDELFAGYSTLQAHRLVEYYEALLPGFIRHQFIPWLVDHLPVSFDNLSLDFKLRRFIAGRGIPIIMRHHQWLGSFNLEQKQKLLQPWTQLSEKDTYHIAFQHQHNSQAQEAVNQLLYCDLKMYLEGDILPKVDRASMANSLEVRVPLLNHTLVEYVAQIPHSMKLHGLTTKYILKQTMKNHLPPQVLRRGKKGFNMPVAKWFTSDLRPLLEEMLSPTRLQAEGFFNVSYVQKLLREHLQGKQDHRKLLWTLLVFELWYEHWGNSENKL